MGRLSDLSEAMLGEMVRRSVSQTQGYISTGIVMQTEDYRVKAIAENGEVSPWLNQFCPTQATVDDIIIYWVNDGFGAYFGVLEPRLHEDDTVPDTDYTVPRIASDLYTEDQRPEPLS